MFPTIQQFNNLAIFAYCILLTAYLSPPTATLISTSIPSQTLPGFLNSGRSLPVTLSLSLLISPSLSLSINQKSSINNPKSEILPISSSPSLQVSPSAPLPVSALSQPAPSTQYPAPSNFPFFLLLNLNLSLSFTDSAPPSHTTAGRQVLETLAGIFFQPNTNSALQLNRSYDVLILKEQFCFLKPFLITNLQPEPIVMIMGKYFKIRSNI